jgi:hypothetical protein
MKTTFLKILIFSYILFFSATYSFSQKKSSRSSGSTQYKWGVGVKLGDPTGITVKRYFGNNALELIAGRAYYYGAYYDYYYHDNRYHNAAYVGPGQEAFYGFSNPLSLQVRYLIHKNINDLRGLRWYFGFGGQVRSISYYYYNYDVYGNYYGVSRATDVAFGGDGLLGLEYTFEDIPLSVFADVNLYLEFYRRPFYPEGQGGIGVRYNFK